ncbi:MAG: hypothetical protein Q4D58_11910 [Synergistaceae bacterium]|nr:hypothetical protein [Synergistaceae bacterium]
MMRYDRIALGRQAKDLGFVRDTFEKVCRLAEILRFMEQDELLSACLALKGGTAINLTIFNLPREEMLVKRKIVSARVRKYMEGSGYVILQSSS